MENWLKKWRLNMSPEKCQYVIFSKSLKMQNEKNLLNLKLFNVNIPNEF